MLRLVLGPLALGIVGLTLALVAYGKDERDGISWRTDLEAARADARESGKPLLVVFR